MLFRSKLYTKSEARKLMQATGFEDVHVDTVLGPGDLLNIKASNRFRASIWNVAWKLYPRWFVRLLGNRFGLYLTIEAKKPA